MKYYSPFDSVQILHTQQSDGSFHVHQQVAQLLQQVTQNKVAVAQLIHSNDVVIVDSLSSIVHQCDALITPIANQVISFFVADCFPVVLFDPIQKVIALVHCGWRSLDLDILKKTVNQMRTKFLTESQDIHAWVGPGICTKHYLHKTPPEQFKDPRWKGCMSKNEHNLYSINLSQFINNSLVQLGIKSTEITFSDTCTFESTNQLFSHTRSKQTHEPDGRFVVAAWFTAD